MVLIKICIGLWLVWVFQASELKSFIGPGYDSTEVHVNAGAILMNDKCQGM